MEREELYRAISETEETAMLAQYIREKGYQEGLDQGIRQGIEQGIEQGAVDGLIEGIELGISLRFGAKGLRLMEAVRQIQELTKLQEVKEAVKTARDLCDFEATVKQRQVH